ncbi:MAG: dihydrolipoyl dehydrogenase [Syntrophobacteraceae bacterium]
MGELTQETEVLVVGGGPGGYAAAFRAADLGMDVTVLDAEGRLGGVCLFRGCIPSKTLLHVAELLHDAKQAREMGLTFGAPQLDLDQLRRWKSQVVEKLAGGLSDLAKKRGVQVIKGRGVFEGSNLVRVAGGEISHFKFRHAIIATGSHVTPLPGGELKAGGRIMGSTGALALADIPGKLLVVGGGYVGMELGSVFGALGSEVTVVELGKRIMAGADADLVQPVARQLEELFKAIHLNTGVTSLVEEGDQVHATFEGKENLPPATFDRALIAIGRRPNTKGIGLENTQVKTDERGFIQVDEQRRTADPHIFAIGDVIGGAMLAHKAMHEGKVAAEVIAGQPSAFDFQAIPAVVYTDPQIAWCGLTEDEARRQKRRVEVARFPWSASGRAASLGIRKGMTKLIVDPESGLVLGMGIVGREAGEMIAEGVLAIEMGALAEDLALTIHPHPTLSEGEEEAAEAFLGSSTHILPMRKAG